MLRGDLSAQLVKLQHGPEDLSDCKRLTVGSNAAGSMTAGQVQAHNRKVAEAEAGKNQRAAELRQGLREHKDQLAQLLESVMHRTAGLRLERLRIAHTRAGVHASALYALSTSTVFLASEFPGEQPTDK